MYGRHVYSELRVFLDMSGLFTVRQFSERNPAWTESALRNLIHAAKPRQSSKGTIAGNGLECRQENIDS